MTYLQFIFSFSVYLILQNKIVLNISSANSFKHTTIIIKHMRKVTTNLFSFIKRKIIPTKCQDFLKFVLRTRFRGAYPKRKLEKTFQVNLIYEKFFFQMFHSFSYQLLRHLSPHSAIRIITLCYNKLNVQLYERENFVPSPVFSWRPFIKESIFSHNFRDTHKKSRVKKSSAEGWGFFFLSFRGFYVCQ